MKHLALGCWYTHLDLHEDIQISLKTTFIYVSEGFFVDLEYCPDLLIGFQVPLLLNHEDFLSFKMTLSREKSKKERMMLSEYTMI